MIAALTPLNLDNLNIIEYIRIQLKQIGICLEKGKTPMKANSKTITLRLSEKVYSKFFTMAKSDNRPISNFIETAALRYLEQEMYVDEFEMKEILGNKQLLDRLKKGAESGKKRKGKFV